MVFTRFLLVSISHLLYLKMMAPLVPAVSCVLYSGRINVLLITCRAQRLLPSSRAIDTTKPLGIEYNFAGIARCSPRRGSALSPSLPSPFFMPFSISHFDSKARLFSRSHTSHWVPIVDSGRSSRTVLRIKHPVSTQNHDLPRFCVNLGN